MRCPRNIFAGPLTWSMTSPCQGLLWPVLLCEGLLALRALAWVRTPDEKGLRDHNSPMCTLSQNGYGDTLWFTKVLPTFVSCPALATSRRDGIPPSHFPKLLVPCRQAACALQAFLPLFDRGRHVEQTDVRWTFQCRSPFKFDFAQVGNWCEMLCCLEVMKYTHRGARTHDHKVKSLVLYRLS